MKLIPKVTKLQVTRVTKFVKDSNSNDSHDDAFLSHPFSSEEVDKAIRSSHKGKASSYDGLTTEHIILFSGHNMRDVLDSLFNLL